MNTITRRIKAAIEHRRVEKLFRQELKRTDLSRFHKKMTDHSHPFLTMYRGQDYKEAIQLATKVLDGTEMPKLFSIFATLGQQPMDERVANRLLEYNRLISERADAHREIDARYKSAAVAPKPLLGWALAPFAALGLARKRRED